MKADSVLPLDIDLFAVFRSHSTPVLLPNLSEIVDIMANKDKSGMPLCECRLCLECFGSIFLHSDGFFRFDYLWERREAEEGDARDMFPNPGW